MHSAGETAGERLGSVALRYRRMGVRPRRLGWAGGEGMRWQLWPGVRAEEAPIGVGPTARTGPMARLEAVLFLAREPMPTRKLAQLAGLADGTEARTLARKLNGLYDEEGCAFRAMEVAGGFQLMTRPQFAPWLWRLHGSVGEVRLSQPALETLSVVAYRQPVLRAEVEAIRGVQCGEVLRQLMERDLVRIVGRSEELGRPFLYGTTRQFLQLFGLRHLDELPRPGLRRASALSRQEGGPGQPEATTPSGEASDGAVHSRKTEGEVNVMNSSEANVVAEEAIDAKAPITAVQEEATASGGDDDYEDHDYDDFEEDDLDEFEEEDEDEDEEDEDDDFEESEWEEVGDDEDEEEDEDLEEEPWDDEDEPWDEDDEEEDWDEDEDWD